MAFTVYFMFVYVPPVVPMLKFTHSNQFFILLLHSLQEISVIEWLIEAILHEGNKQSTITGRADQHFKISKIHISYGSL
jgi:hypothetical protein